MSAARSVRPVVVAALAVTVAAVLLGTAGPATAAPVTPAPRPVAVSADGGVRAVADVSGVAGWNASLPAATRHSSVVTFRVPSAVCPGRTTDPLFLGTVLFGQASSTDTTFAYASGDVTVTCTEGVPFYSAGVVTSTTERQSGAVSPGDELEVKTTVTSTATKVTMTDTTSGGVFRVTGAPFVANAIQTSVQGGFGTGKFPKPTPVKFTAVTADGTQLARLSPFGYDQTDAMGATVLATSALTDRSGFRVTFVRQP